jgi:hypothetical protein
MVKTKKYNEDEAKTLSLELQAEVLKLKTTLEKLENSVNSLANGEYWNGANAYDVNQSLVGHLDHDKTLLSKLEKCSEQLNAIVK